MPEAILAKFRAVIDAAGLDDRERDGYLAELGQLAGKREELMELLYRSHTELERLVEGRSRELEEINRRLQEEMAVRRQVETEREEMRNRMMRMEKMEAMGTLAGGVAHDFNNLLTVIRGNADLLAMRNQSGAAPELDGIINASRRAAGLTRQLLLFSRNQPCEPVVLNVNTVVEDLVGMLRRLIGEDIRIQLDLERELRPVRFDPVNLDRIVTNLALNARDAMPGGGVFTIRTRTMVLGEEDCRIREPLKPGSYVCLEIEDTGCGMDDATRERIFEPFFTTKSPEHGTGIGLAVVFGIISSCGGWIDTVSAPGSGTAFIMYIPAVDRDQRPAGSPEQGLERFRGNGERILLVEDDDGVRGLAQRGLERYGYAVSAAAGQSEALRMFEREGRRFDLALCDVVLKNASGVALAERLQELAPDLRILLTSGYTDKKARYNYIRSLLYPYMPKPFTLHSLLQSVQGVLHDPLLLGRPAECGDAILVTGPDRSLAGSLAERLAGVLRVHTAGSGEEAVGMAAKARYAAILLHTGLPDINGFDVLARIMRMNRKQRVILLAERTDTRTVVRAMRLGAYTIVGCPPDVNELIHEIRRVVRTGRPAPDEDKVEEFYPARGTDERPGEQPATPVHKGG